MNIVKIGAIIKYERVKQNISIEKLAKGVCSESVIRRTEAGERGAGRSYDQALTLTLPEFSLEKLENYLLGENELILLTLYLNNNEKLGKNLLKTYGITILDYIERHFYDEEIKCNLYGRVSLIVGNSYIKNNRPDEALKVILKAEQM